MKNVLTAIIALAIVIMPYTYFYNPALNQNKSQKQEIANLQAAIQRYSGAMLTSMQELLKSQREILIQEHRNLNFMLPAFVTARANLMTPFDELRSQVPGEWAVVPEGKFNDKGTLIFWPFKFKYIGSAPDAIKVLAHMEGNTQLMRLENYKMKTNGRLVTLSGKIELVYQDKLLEEGVLK